MLLVRPRESIILGIRNKMPFYPLLEGPECNGSVELFNFAPNDWEDASFRERFLNVSWADGSLWHSKCISVVSPGASVSVSRNDLSYLPKSKFGFLSLSKNLLPETTDILPSINDCHTLVPNWRSSLGLNDFKGGKTSYQGEIEPFPQGASMLSFSPFEQKFKNIENYFIFINLEKSPLYRKTDLKIFNPLSMKLLKTEIITSNSITIINIDNLCDLEENLLLMASENMAGIPLYFSRNKITRQMSLEHTHPPASFAIHGKRFAVQQELKKIWFERIKNTI